MKKIANSTKIFFALIIIMAIVEAAAVFLPQSITGSTGQNLPPLPLMALASFFMVLVLYGGLGFAGLKLSPKTGFPAIWGGKDSVKNKLLFPALVGIIVGIIFIIADIIFTKLLKVQPLQHPAFPLSLIASFVAGISEETIFRLFLIPFLVWIISNKILKQKKQNIVFWCVSVFSALAFALGHIPSVMALLEIKTIAEIQPLLFVEIVLLNGLISMVAAYSFRKHGIISAMGIHFWADVIWHVVYGGNIVMRIIIKITGGAQ